MPAPSEDSPTFETAIERLEQRINPSVTASFAAGVLTVTSDGAGDNVLITDLDGNGSVDVDDLNTVGIDFANYPIPRGLNFGLRLGF